MDKTKYKTEEERFWRGEFGDSYIERNESELILASNLAMFSKIIRKTSGIASIIEFGSNIGMNLKAIKCLLPKADYSAIEINHSAADQLENDPFWDGNIKVFEETILDFQVEKKYDLVLIKGVLIHINPEELDNVYSKLYKASSKYVCIAEYYNPTPVMVPYRGYENRLYKRDFAGEFMDKYPDVRLVDYGFEYHRDNVFDQNDDITWFLLEKINET